MRTGREKDKGKGTQQTSKRMIGIKKKCRRARVSIWLVTAKSHWISCVAENMLSFGWNCRPRLYFCAKCAETSFYQQRHVLKRQQSECECIYLVCAQNANKNRLASANMIAHRKWNRCGKKSGNVLASQPRNIEQLEMKLINDSHVTFIHNTLDFLWCCRSTEIQSVCVHSDGRMPFLLLAP